VITRARCVGFNQHRGGKGHGTAGSGGARRRRARGTSGHLRGRTPAPQGRRRQAPQDRRRLTFFWGWAEIRRSRLWPLKVVLDALRVHAAQYKTRPSQAEHVAGRAGPAGSRDASQLLGTGEPQGPGTAGVGRNVLIAVLEWLAIWNRRALTPLRAARWTCLTTHIMLKRLQARDPLPRLPVQMCVCVFPSSRGFLFSCAMWRMLPQFLQHSKPTHAACCPPKIT
jgi:hypothetical protein